MIDYRKLIDSGVHFGHQTSRWCPKMQSYIFGVKNKTHLIDVTKTARQTDKARAFLEKLTAEGKLILWIGTKKAANKAIQDLAQEVNMPFVTHRWVGGTLSNFSQVKKSVTKLLHLEEVLQKGDKTTAHYTKKELNVIQKVVERLDRSVGGLKKLVWPVGAIVVVDVSKEASAVREAKKMGIPVVALVDTNGDPSLVDYVIPGNDDDPKAIAVIIDYLKEGVKAGIAVAGQKGSVAAQKAVDAEEAQDIVSQTLVLGADEEAVSSDDAKKKVLRKPPVKGGMPQQKRSSYNNKKVEEE
ncbi:30S ribosomal protein S2 [bacterium]|nr:MAG: 30S ribosomal protein S2 [bacterium]QQR61689.1 MAG: 30S ribosomal protein S2 [bacterium]QQR62744.1 MAG: 30S ribosomal protein S2 [bacterium]